MKLLEQENARYRSDMGKLETQVEGITDESATTDQNVSEGRSWDLAQDLRSLIRLECCSPERAVTADSLVQHSCRDPPCFG